MTTYKISKLIDSNIWAVFNSDTGEIINEEKTRTLARAYVKRMTELHEAIAIEGDIKLVHEAIETTPVEVFEVFKPKKITKASQLRDYIKQLKLSGKTVLIADTKTEVINFGIEILRFKPRLAKKYAEENWGRVTV